MFIKYEKQSYPLIPENTLAYAEVTVKMGYSELGEFVTQSKNNPENYQLNMELRLLDPKYKGKKIFHHLAVKSIEGQEWRVEKGKRDLVHMICAINGISLKEYEESARNNKPLKFMLEKDYSNLGGNKVFVSIGIEEAKGNYPAKNKINYFAIPGQKLKTTTESEIYTEAEDDSVPF